MKCTVNIRNMVWNNLCTFGEDWFTDLGSLLYIIRQDTKHRWQINCMLH